MVVYFESINYCKIVSLTTVASNCYISLLTLISFYLADIISTVEFNQTGELLATGDKGGRVVIFQREATVGVFVTTGLVI